MAKKKARLKKKTIKKTPKKSIRKSVKAKKLEKKAPAKAKKTAKKAVSKKSALSKQDIIGTITHYFPKVRAAVIKLKAPLSAGSTVKIKGHTTDFLQNVVSMQIDRVPVDSAKKGQEIGLLVDSRVRQHDIVYKEKLGGGRK